LVYDGVRKQRQISARQAIFGAVCGLPRDKLAQSRNEIWLSPMNFAKMTCASRADDADPEETAEWVAALESVVRAAGEERAEFILSALDRKAKELGVGADVVPYSPYRNSIPLERQPPFSGDIAMEERITAIIRWNALAMVVRANKTYGELGGHIASYASAAEIFETGFNHFFRADTGSSDGDLVFFQPHSAPGIYARAFLEGRLSEEQLKHYRQEVGGAGLRLLSPSVAHARFLAGADRLDGARANHRRLSGALPPLSAASWPRQHREAACLGHLRRRRNG
jgi:hypothetical protein